MSYKDFAVMGAVKISKVKENLSGLCSTRSSSEMVGCIKAWPRQIVYIHSKLNIYTVISHISMYLKEPAAVR